MHFVSEQVFRLLPNKWLFAHQEEVNQVESVKRDNQENKKNKKLQFFLNDIKIMIRTKRLNLLIWLHLEKRLSVFKVFALHSVG